MIAFLLEPRGPPGCELAKELGEQELGLLFELRPKLRGPRLGTKEARFPLLTRGLNADALAPGLPLLLSGLSGAWGGGPSSLRLTGLDSLRTRSTASFARGSGGVAGAEAPAERMAGAGGVAGSPRCARGVILMVTGLHTARGCRSDQMVRFR